MVTKHVLIAIGIILYTLLLLHNNGFCGEEVEFRDWYGVYENGQKMLATYSGDDSTMLFVYIDKENYFRLKFQPSKKVKVATFDGKQYRGMNFGHLYGYDHWIMRMKRHHFLRVWFVGEKRPYIFSLNGFSKAVNWLY